MSLADRRYKPLRAGAFYGRSPEEVAAGVRPTDQQWPVGNLSRYGGSPSRADNSRAVSDWLDVGQEGVVLTAEPGTYACPSWAVKSLSSPVTIRGPGAHLCKLTGPGFSGTTADSFVKTLADFRMAGVWLHDFYYGVQVGALTAWIDLTITECRNTDTRYFVVREEADCNSYGVQTFDFLRNTIDHAGIPDTTLSRGVFLQGRYRDAAVAYNVLRNVRGRGIVLGRNEYADQDEMRRAVVIGNHLSDIRGQAGTESQGILVYGVVGTIVGNVLERISSANPTNCEGIYTKLRHGVIANNSLFDAGFTEAAINIKGSGRSGTSSPQGFAILCVNNNIRFSANASTKGIYIQQEDVLVAHNYIEGASLDGIYSAPDLTLNNVSVLHNRIVKSTAARAILLRHNGRGLRVIGNEALEVDSAASHLDVVCIYIDPLLGTLEDVDVLDNEVFVDSGCQATGSIRCVQFVRTAPINNVRVARNRLTASNAVPTYGLVLSGLAGGDNWTIEDNDWSGVEDYPFALTAGDLPTNLAFRGRFARQTTGAGLAEVIAFPLPDNCAAALRAKVVAVEADASDRALYRMEGLFYRDGGAATQQGATADLVTPIESDANWSASLDADANNARLRVDGNGDTVNWRADVELELAA